MDLGEDSLVHLSEDLVAAETSLREGNIKKCLEQYNVVCEAYEELNDYETASYFHNRCLEISQDDKYVDGEALAYMGLGVCEEKVLNIFESMKYLEIALEKAIDAGLGKIIIMISEKLVMVYENIAQEYQQKEEYDNALDYYEKCLDACEKSDQADMKANCYYRIGIIYEKMSDLEKAVVYVNKFLDICTSNQ